MKLITWTAVAAKASLLAHIEIWARQALTDMFEMGKKDQQEICIHFDSEQQRIGATDMKKRILEALPEEVEVSKGNYINLRETVAETIKSIQSQ